MRARVGAWEDACRLSRAGVGSGPVETPDYRRSSGAAAGVGCRPLLRFVQPGSEAAVGEGARRLLHSSRSSSLDLRACSSSNAGARPNPARLALCLPASVRRRSLGHAWACRPTRIGPRGCPVPRARACRARPRGVVRPEHRDAARREPPRSATSSRSSWARTAKRSGAVPPARALPGRILRSPGSVSR
jgi:hypothetical protein